MVHKLSNHVRARLVREIGDADRVAQQGNLTEARTRFKAIEEEAGKLGIRSGDLEWYLARVLDNLGEPVAAFDHVLAALELDPLAAHINRSFDIIVERLHSALSAAPAEEDVQPIYERLRRAGAADEACHVAMARRLVAAGRTDEAIALLDSVTRLYPNYRDAWVELMEAAKKAGQADVVSRVERELTLLDHGGDLGGEGRATA